MFHLRFKIGDVYASAQNIGVAEILELEPQSPAPAPAELPTTVSYTNAADILRDGPPAAGKVAEIAPVFFRKRIKK